MRRRFSSPTRLPWCSKHLTGGEAHGVGWSLTHEMAHEGEVGRRLRELRRLRRWTQDDVAAALVALAVKLEEPVPSVDALLVSKWERGERNPGRYYRPRLCLALGAAPKELGMEPTPRLLADLEELRRRLGIGGKLLDEEDEAERRAFLALLGVAGFGSGLVDLERLAAPTVDALFVQDADALTRALLGRWYSSTPVLLLPPVLAHLRGLQRALPGTPELESLTGQTALLAGHLLTMLERPGEARGCYALAESLARDSRDGNLEIATLICRSALHDWRRGGQPRRSAELVEGAAALLNAGTPPALRVWVLARRAEERATAGDITGFQRGMAQAEAALGPSSHEWYGPRDAAELAAFRGASELLLGQHREAAATLTWTLERMDPNAVNWRALVAADRDRALGA